MYALNIKDMTNNTCVCINYIFTQRKTISRIKTFFPLVTSFTWRLRSLCLCGFGLCIREQRVQRSCVWAVKGQIRGHTLHSPFYLHSLRSCDAALPLHSHTFQNSRKLFPWLPLTSIQPIIALSSGWKVCGETSDRQTRRNRLMFWRLTPPAGAHERTRD